MARPAEPTLCALRRPGLAARQLHGRHCRAPLPRPLSCRTWPRCGTVPANSSTLLTFARTGCGSGVCATDEFCACSRTLLAHVSATAQHAEIVAGEADPQLQHQGCLLFVRCVVVLAYSVLVAVNCATRYTCGPLVCAGLSCLCVSLQCIRVFVSSLINFSPVFCIPRFFFHSVDVFCFLFCILC